MNTSTPIVFELCEQSLDSPSMMNFRALICLAVLSQKIFAGKHQANSPDSLKDIVPRREFLYVGGQYTNITVRVNPRFDQFPFPPQPHLTPSLRTRLPPSSAKSTSKNSHLTHHPHTQDCQSYSSQAPPKPGQTSSTPPTAGLAGLPTSSPKTTPSTSPTSHPGGVRPGIPGTEVNVGVRRWGSRVWS